MAQPLPDWLKPVTLRYQDSNKFTTGLVQLPISYSGPSIPLAWPYTSVAISSPTASPPPLSAAPSPTKIINFIDGSGPFTVIGDIIITAPAAATSPPMSATSMIFATPVPSAILVSTIVIAQPTLTTDPNRPSSYPIVLGTIILLSILMTFIFAVTIAFIKCHTRRKCRVGTIGNDCDWHFKETHHEFYTGPQPPDAPGSPAPPIPSRNFHDHLPILVHKHTSVNTQIEDKELIQSETQFHIVPQHRHERRAAPWLRWKKLIPKLQIFGNKNDDRADIAYSPPLTQIRVHYSNPYHDPSINTDTDERISRWRTKCSSPSSSALHLPSTITSNKRDIESENKNSRVHLSKKFPLPSIDSFGFKNRSAYAETDGAFKINPSSTISGPKAKLTSRGCEALKDFSPSKVLRTGAIHTLLECASPRRNVIESDSECSKDFNNLGALSKAATRMSRSLRALPKSSRITAKGSTINRYLEDSPPLLISENDVEAFENDHTDPGDSPLDFITIPLRSPPRCRRGTLTTSPATLTIVENSFDSVRLPQTHIPSGPIPPLGFPTQVTRQNEENLPAAPGSSFSNPTDSRKLRHHVYESELSPSLSPPISTSSPDTTTLPGKNNCQPPIIKHSNPAFWARQSLSTSNVTRIKSIPNASGLDVHMDIEGSNSFKAMKSKKNVDTLAAKTASNGLVLPMKQRPTIPDQGLVDKLDEKPNERVSVTSQNCYNDEVDIFNGYFGSGSISYAGGVNELGILEKNDRSLEIEMDSHTSGSVRRARKSPQSSFEMVEGEGNSRVLEHLFYVNPQLIHASGSRPVKIPTEARDGSEKSLQESEFKNGLKKGNHDEIVIKKAKHDSDFSARARLDYHVEKVGGNILQSSRRSASSSVLGSLSSLGTQSRRCLSFPNGTENYADILTSNNRFSILPMLRDTRSPLQRITETWRKISTSGEEDKGEGESDTRHEVGNEDEDDEADENCRLLLDQHDRFSRCMRSS